MTIKEIIDKTDTLKPNQYSAADKMDWLSDLDGRVMKEVMLRHEYEMCIRDSYGMAYTLEN